MQAGCKPVKRRAHGRMDTHEHETTLADTPHPNTARSDNSSPCQILQLQNLTLKLQTPRLLLLCPLSCDPPHLHDQLRPVQPAEQVCPLRAAVIQAVLGAVQNRHGAGQHPAAVPAAAPRPSGVVGVGWWEGGGEGEGDGAPRLVCEVHSLGGQLHHHGLRKGRGCRGCAGGCREGEKG